MSVRDGLSTPLAGNVSAVTRVGDTVRRTVGPWSPAVHAVLQHLARQGEAGAPRFLGLGDARREQLTYIPGITIPEAHGPDVTMARLESAARLLRRLHESLDNFVLPPQTTWHPRYSPGPEDGPCGVCHMDMHPANTVFDGDTAVALIDWDMTGVVPRAWDVAWAAWAYVPLADDDGCRRKGWETPPDRAARLRHFCDAYGLAAEERAKLPGLAARLAGQQILDIERAAAEGVTSARWLAEEVGSPRLVRRQIGWIREHRAGLIAALIR